MKGRERMLPSKNNFKNIFKRNALCLRSEKETDNEDHLYGKFELLGDLYLKYNITSPLGLQCYNILHKGHPIIIPEQ